jgi:hypothetical protein
MLPTFVQPLIMETLNSVWRVYEFVPPSPSELRKRFYPGLTVASGIEIGGGRPRVLPEFRYTRWLAVCRLEVSFAKKCSNDN